MKKRDLLSRLVTPTGTNLFRTGVPDWETGTTGGFPTGTNQRFCSSERDSTWESEAPGKVILVPRQMIVASDELVASGLSASLNPHKSYHLFTSDFYLIRAC